MRATLIGVVTAALLTTLPARGQLPPPPAAWADWDTAWHPDDPGELSAESLLDKPAGHRGPVVARDGHFYSGDRRVKFWGVNLAFGANFPPHAVADQLARRFSRYGINAVRFHHMDNQPFPNGIFADWGLDKLSPEALDRLDYFVAALKAQGVYADLNLHVSREYFHFHKTADGHDGPKLDKVVDIFDPVLIEAQRRYARDLLTHVNAYTHARYADEPAVGLVEINNENSLFMWGAEERLAGLPEPYAGELRRQWNGWLAKRYGTREKLAAAWATAADPAGPNLLRDPGHAAAWNAEHHGDDKVAVTEVDNALHVSVGAVDGTAWHAQLNQPGLKLVGGKSYHVTFTAKSDRPVTVGINVGQGHDPWQSLGLGRPVKLTTDRRAVSMGFTAAASDDNARLSFTVGSTVAAIDLADVSLHAGGTAPGLATDESVGSVRCFADDAPPPRRDDWLRFLADTEAAYFDGMRDYLHRDLGVLCPITGTIGFGPFGTSVQAHADFVDAHAYWQHPQFPGKDWDGAHWTIENTPMVDEPAKATLWGLAATRVAGKPFTVTEYQHPAPSDWQAECIPEIATFAALQDWDGVFLFAYSHDANYDKKHVASFFDLEGNPAKMPLMPMGARLFLGGAVPALTGSFTYTVTPADALAGANGTDLAAFVGGVVGGKRLKWIDRRSSIRFADGGPAEPPVRGTPVVGWPPGHWSLERAGAVVRVDIDARPGATPPFASVVVVPADPLKPIASADRLLVTAVARVQSTGMQWNADRTSVGTNWGHAPAQIEVVRADVTVPGRWSHAWALDPAGRRTAVDVAEPGATDTVLHLGRSTAIAYVVER